MELYLDPKSIDDYKLFLKIKQLPRYDIRGRVATFPNEYASRLGQKPRRAKRVCYKPNPSMFDYERDITAMAVEKRKFCIFAEPGRGKTFMFLDYARHCVRSLPAGKCVLIVSPLMVISQTIAEANKFYGGDLEIEQVPAGKLQQWLNGDRKHRIGITNYEAFKQPIKQGDLGALIGDETSLLKSHYGKYGRGIIQLGKGIQWKLANTGTPAPNDRIEYGNHAIFMDQFPTINAFLARYFVNRGQTDNRWEMKPHALEPFYRSLSHWAFFLHEPSTYGWKDHAEPLPPIHTHFHNVPMTAEQERLTMQMSGQLIPTKAGGITKRSSWGQIAKGWYRKKRVATNKPAEILRLVDSFGGEGTIIWCLYNQEQKIIEEVFPDAASIKGETPLNERIDMIAQFKACQRKVLISKAKVLGFGLNLQVATRQIFSGLQDSYEGFYQCVKRSNRVGSILPLHVHIPLTDIEEPMVETVMRRAKMVQEDTENQERIFAKVWREQQC
jgi:superfamily II DNA or RNA helicase